MTSYAVKQDENEEWRILEKTLEGRWRAVARDLDDEDLADEIFELIENDELDAGTILPVVTMDGRSDRRAVHFCTADQKRSLGYVIDDAPVGGRPRDEFDR